MRGASSASSRRRASPAPRARRPGGTPTARLALRLGRVASTLLIGLVATCGAAATWWLGGAPVASLDWAAYDRWLRDGAAPPGKTALVVIARDAESEARLGGAAWDSAVLARTITSLARAGAVTIGVDALWGPAGAPSRGGAAGEALLSQALTLADVVVAPVTLEVIPAGAAARGGGAPRAAHSSWLPASKVPARTLDARLRPDALPGLAERARALGHTLSPLDADGLVRRAPLFVRVDDRAVPAFGLALATTYLDVRSERITAERRAVVLEPSGNRAPLRIPVDAEGEALIGFAGSGAAPSWRHVTFSEVWTAIEQGRTEALRGLVDEKLVLLLVGPARRMQGTPVGAMSDFALQAHLLHTVLRGAGPRTVSPGWAVTVALAVALATAWAWLAWPWWAGLMGSLTLLIAHLASLPLALAAGGLALPAWPPVAAVVLASAGAWLWNHFAVSVRTRRLEGENARVREMLAKQEAAADALEEDLETARASIARSSSAERELGRAVEALRGQVEAARTQEEETRRRLEGLERELRGLRAASPAEADVTDAEQARLQRECERMGIVTRDPGMLAVFRDLEKGARSSLPILLLGEPGTGKELFARAAHRLSDRAERPFVAVNMAAIAPELFESELFGHVRGSFTGAIADRKGYFEQADRGTIFLDEVGEVRPDHQSKLLRVLQDRTFNRVGASRPSVVDVRIVAASNRDLERGVAEGWFREDLYFRVKGLVLRLPPLRERPGDLPLLAARLLSDAAAEARRDGVALTEDAVRALQDHDWPGNVRELQQCLRQAVALAETRLIGSQDLRLPAPRRVRPHDVATDPEDASDAAVLASLRRHGFDMQATARALGWDRSTVTQRLKGLAFRALVDAEGDRARAALDIAGSPADARVVEVKLREYHAHLLRAVEAFDSVDAALGACRRRFKNLPERHFRSLESLVRQHFGKRPPTPTG
jgi:DNA-binding NtrC family response regulator/CHASE2 domain-containing sensor protein